MKDSFQITAGIDMQFPCSICNNAKERAQWCADNCTWYKGVWHPGDPLGEPEK